MKLKIYTVVLLICTQVIFCDENKGEEDEQDAFVPTHEWKTIRKGQKVPEGLYIRINLETGISEAKLLDKDDKGKDNALSVTANENNEITSDDDQLSPNDLKEALKLIKNDMKEEEIKGNYRSYDDLKKDFEELNIKQKTDAEILKDLIERHVELMSRKEIDYEEILTILEDLEYLVHQYDNANDFVQMKGLKNIVYKNLNSTNSEIKRETLKLLGASIQNNVKVKAKALDTGCVDILLRMIVLESDSSVKYRALFALGGLLRGFPFAQRKFVENAGLSVFAKLFEMENLKIQMKTLTIINDLLQEEDSVMKEKDQKSSLYKEVNMRKNLLGINYCDIFNKLLINSITIESNDHDIIEKSLEALLTVIDDCKSSLTMKSKDILISLRNLYWKLSEKEEKIETDSNTYYSMLYDLANNIVIKFQKNKDEL